MEILDCTLRDGGYYTNWDFDDAVAEAYFKAMELLPVSVLEIGYRNKPLEGYSGKYSYCPPFVLEQVREWAPTKKIAIMLNEKDCSIEQLDELLLPCKAVADIIRITVDPKRFDSALALAKEIKARGFVVAFNLMYMSTLVENNEVFNKVAQLAGIVDYLNLVDSYGGIFPDQVREIVKLCKTKTNITLGFHGHNNLELAFANSLAAIEAGCEIIDGTITGMGRGAGNLKTELLLTYLATKKEVDVDFNSLATVVSVFEEMQKAYGWGTNLPYMVSGVNSLPQKDVMDWVTKRFYSINSILQALQNQKIGTKDNLKLPVFTSANNQYSKVLMIGGGTSAVTHAKAISTFVQQEQDICIIHASSKNALEFQHLQVPQYFCLVGNEGHRLENIFNDLEHIKAKAILPPYPRRMGTYVPSAIISRSFELYSIGFTNKFVDSHTVLALQTALELGALEVYLAGYDGYTKDSISNREQGLFQENGYTFSKFKETNVKLISITPTQYEEPAHGSIYSLITNGSMALA